MSGRVLLQLLGGTKGSRALRRWINLWPPFLGAGVRITYVAADMKSVDVEMKLRFWNANYVGTHFGGSLFAMTDPFYMLMLMANLGRDYIVWDDIREKLKTLPKYEPVFLVEVKDEAGVVIAEVEKVLHVRKKPAAQPSGK
jgi:hypothetical protein